MGTEGHPVSQAVLYMCTVPVAHQKAAVRRKHNRENTQTTEQREG
jgi:hypothetical protein